MAWKKIITATGPGTPVTLRGSDLLTDETRTVGDILKIIEEANAPYLAWHKDQQWTDSGIEPTTNFNTTGAPAQLGFDIHDNYSNQTDSLSFGPFLSVSSTYDTGTCMDGASAYPSLTTEADCLAGDSSNGYATSPDGAAYTWTYGYTPASAVSPGDAYSKVPGSVYIRATTSGQSITGNVATGMLNSLPASQNLNLSVVETNVFMSGQHNSSHNLPMGSTGVSGSGEMWTVDDPFHGELDSNTYAHINSYTARFDSATVGFNIGDAAKAVHNIEMTEIAHNHGHLRNIGSGIVAEHREYLLHDIETPLYDNAMGNALNPHDDCLDGSTCGDGGPSTCLDTTLCGTGIQWSGTDNNGTTTAGVATDKFKADNFLGWTMGNNNAFNNTYQDTTTFLLGAGNIAVEENIPGNFNEMKYQVGTETAEAGNLWIGQMPNGSLTITASSNQTYAMILTFDAEGGGSVTNADFPYTSPDVDSNVTGAADAAHVLGAYEEHDGFAAGQMRLMYVGDGMKCDSVGGGGQHYPVLEAEAGTNAGDYRGPTGLSTMGLNPTFRMSDPGTLYRGDTTWSENSFEGNPVPQGSHSDTTNNHEHSILAHSVQSVASTDHNNILFADGDGAITVETMIIQGSLISPGQSGYINSFSGDGFQVRDDAMQFNIVVGADGTVADYSSISNTQVLTLGEGAIDSAKGLALKNNSQVDVFTLNNGDNGGDFKTVGGCDNDLADLDGTCTGTYVYGAKHLLVHGQAQALHTTNGLDGNGDVTGTFVPIASARCTIKDRTGGATLAHHYGDLVVDTFITSKYAVVGRKLGVPNIDATSETGAENGHVGWSEDGGVKSLYLFGEGGEGGNIIG